MILNKTISILLIEDNEDDVFLLKEAFKNIPDARIEKVMKDGEKVIEYLFEKLAEPDVDPFILLLDINLPGLNGFEILEKIKNNTELRVIPVVFLTTSNNTEDIKKSYRLGAASYICKPGDFHDYQSLTKDIVEYWKKVKIFLGKS